jgi:hypothetical protein
MDLIEAFNQSGWFAKLSLLAGFIPLWFATAYALRPAERTLALLRPVSLAAMFAAISGVTAGLIAVLRGVAVTLPEPFAARADVYVGLSEAMVPVFVNFGCLAVSWALVGIGMLRRQRLE